MKRESKAERAAWTALMDGTKPKASKYRAVRTGRYASKKEADVAMKLAVLERAGEIYELREQVRIELLPGKGSVRPIFYVADFQYRDKNGVLHTLDVKGMRTPIYSLKKKMMYLLLGVEIEEC